MAVRHESREGPRRALRRGGAAAAVAVALCSLPGVGAPAASATTTMFLRHRRPLATTTTTVPASGLPVPAPPAPAPEDTCVPGTWASAQGAPLAYVNGIDAAYLWHDADGGWALRVTHSGPRSKAVFSGSLTATTGQFVNVGASPGTGNDIVYLSADKRTVLFRFVNFGALDGLDFATHCTRAIVVHLRLGAANLGPAHVFVGTTGTHPPKDPFRVARSARLGPAGTPRAAVAGRGR